MRSSNRVRTLTLGRSAGISVLIAAAALVNACAARQTDPLLPPTVIAARDRNARALQSDIAGLFAAPALQRSLTAVRIDSLDQQEVLFRYNDERRVLPASCLKIVTYATAAERLGWDYRFVTRLYATGPIVDGVLQGDLIVTGSGDPAFSARYEGPDVVFAHWAERLKEAGIRSIAGRLVGDDRAFGAEHFGPGWGWDDLANGYAAPVGALQANDNVAMVTVTPGGKAGELAATTLADPHAGLALEARVDTVEPGTSTSVVFERPPGTATLRVSGGIPAGAPPIVRPVAVADATRHFLGILRDVFESHGVLTTGGIVDVASAGVLAGPTRGPLVEHRSPPLSEIAAIGLKTSHNLHAESVFRVLGASGGGGASTALARESLRGTLSSWGIPPDAVVIADGSGLSRYTYVTADALMTVLRRMAGDERHRDHWMAAFPAGGTEGTLSARFTAGTAHGRVRAKTGTMMAVRSLAGYVRSDAGELLAFVMIVNNAVGTREEVDAVLDAAVERLVAFRR
jgi:D-alanyl-D-alanine carboxypeptidase/D-alanyl-D-alanine-endopeptidase (penicillin-binding protein 4)